MTIEAGDFSAEESVAMVAALEQALRARRTSSPNPPVGAVIIAADGVTVGVGYTSIPGRPHAEVNALTAAGELARGATMVCTLEPCAHEGRTGPCTEAIIAAGITRVVYAVDDPNPQAAGGAQALRNAGIEVESGLMQQEARSGALRPWLHVQSTGLPFLTWKNGQSLDGQIAAADGSSQWITSPQSRAEAHRLRAQVDAIVVGAGTVRTDDPRLTARPANPGPEVVQPLRIVVTNTGQLPPKASILDGSAPTLVAVGPAVSSETVERLESRGAEVIRAGEDPSEGVDLGVLLVALRDRGVLHLLLEGGPTLAGSFVSAGLVDEIVAYVAPKLLVSGLWPALRGYGVGNIGEAIDLDITDVSMVGPDVRITACPVGPGGRQQPS